MPPERERWESAFLQLLRKLTLKCNRPLILKSPAHTAQLDVLVEMFPAAKFVHIHRDPYAVFQSSVHTWRKVKSFWGLQSGDVDDERIIEDYVQVYDAFFAQRHRLTDENYCEVRFDDLARDPLGQLRHVYQRLKLPAFDYVEPAVQEYIHAINGYARNSFEPMTGPMRERDLLKNGVTRRKHGIRRHLESDLR